MTEFFLNAERVYPKDEGTWKLNIVNTFFEDAGSYTLEISFPLDVIENRNVFGSINRQDVSKRPATFDAKIVADSKLVFCGTAKITGVTDTEVKLQMLGGNSKVNFWTKAEKMYIDEFDYEYTDYNNTMEGFVDKDGQDGLPIIKAGTFPEGKAYTAMCPYSTRAERKAPTTARPDFGTSTSILFIKTTSRYYTMAERKPTFSRCTSLSAGNV